MKHLILLLILTLLISCVPVESDTETVTQIFTYTAQGDDGIVGQADRVIARMAQSQDSLVSNWDDCVIVFDKTPPLPLIKDSVSAEINISTGVTYYFAIKTADEKPNWSGLSNVIIREWEDITAPSPIGDFDAID